MGEFYLEKIKIIFIHGSNVRRGQKRTDHNVIKINIDKVFERDWWLSLVILANKQNVVIIYQGLYSLMKLYRQWLRSSNL